MAVIRLPIKSGSQYIETLNRSQPHVLFQGKQISGKISEHKAFRGLVSSVAGLYDMQGQEEYRDKMTYFSPSSGEPVGLSFMQPKTADDLHKRRIMMSLWAKYHHGFLGRSPDYMNTAIMAYASAADVLSEQSHEFADNLKQYYEYCREHDVTLSHAFLQPTACRLSMFNDSFEDSIGARVHQFGADGMVVSGAFLLATQGVTAEEIFIFPPPVPSFDENESPYTFAFAVPNNLPGIKFICRESYVMGDSHYEYPLSSRFEEMDTLVIFDHVLVPRNRIFLYGDYHIAQQFSRECQFHTHVSHQALCRYIAKTEFFLGLVEYLGKLNGIESASMYEQVTEIVTILEILKSLLVNAELNAAKDRWGTMVPNKNTMLVANSYFPKVYPRMIEIVQTLASSKLIMIPSEKDFRSELGPKLEQYLRLYDTTGRDVTGVYRLAWELSANSFASRQAQFERFFFGSPNTLMERLYSGYPNREQLIDNVIQFLRAQTPDSLRPQGNQD
jgi:4-hydroxyphenylacetate 3-monooxygenase